MRAVSVRQPWAELILLGHKMIDVRSKRTALRERGVLVAGGVSYAGVVTRIGGGGVFFESHAPLQKGQSVLIRFKLACFDEPLIAKGEIRHGSRFFRVLNEVPTLLMIGIVLLAVLRTF